MELKYTNYKENLCQVVLFYICTYILQLAERVSTMYDSFTNFLHLQEEYFKGTDIYFEILHPKIVSCCVTAGIHYEAHRNCSQCIRFTIILWLHEKCFEGTDLINLQTRGVPSCVVFDSLFFFSSQKENSNSNSPGT